MCLDAMPQKWDRCDSGVVCTDFSNALDPLESASEGAKMDCEFDETEVEVDEEEDFETALNSERTDIGVVYRSWTWDFMPPEMVRPLAEVGVGDCVVLAMRMGMVWRALVSTLLSVTFRRSGFLNQRSGCISKQQSTSIID